MKGLICFLMLGGLLLPAPARAEAPAFGGYVKAFGFQHAVESWGPDRAGARLQLSVQGGDAEPVAYFAAVDFDLDSRVFQEGAEWGRGFEVRPVEAWVDLVAGPVELRLGQQYVFWGRTTWVSPTDVLSAWNYAHMASELEDQRVAPVAARLNWYLGSELKLDLVWLPLFTPSRLPTEDGGVLETERPDWNLGHTEAGVRLSQSVSAWAFDWSVSAFRGFEKMPAYFETWSEGNPWPTPTFFHPRLTMVGADAAKAVGPVVLKAEAAYKHVGAPEVQQAVFAGHPDRVEYVAGVDWHVREGLDLGAQYLGTHGFAGDRYDAATTHGASVRLAADLARDWKAQAVGVYEFTDGRLFSLAFVSWEAADALQAIVGAVLFHGPSAEDLVDAEEGMGAGASRLFAELKYSF